MDRQAAEQAMARIVDSMHAVTKMTDGERTFTLGALTDALAAMPPETNLRFGFGSMVPSDLGSWRGTYSLLALGYTTRSSPCTAGTLLADCRAADGGVFEGYKGGSYTMDRDTPIWVDNYGECNHTAIVGVTEAKYGWATILTLDVGSSE